ncbi:MAG TPA: hypothetical protein VK684_15350, partial [Edaphobacter sp.]|nr:hypothetical protein [Edaphobacter sp.]
RNRLIIWGGGHADYAGNEVYSLELNNLATVNPVLIRLDGPSQPDLSAGCPDVWPGGFPPSLHTYDGLVYLPDQDAMLSKNGSKANCGFSTNLTWSLSLNSVLASCAPNCTPSWTNKNPVHFIPGGYNLMTAYDTMNHLVWANDGNTGLWSYDPVANDWTQRSSFAIADNHGVGVYDPVDQYFINIIESSTQPILYWSTASGSTFTMNNPGSLDASCVGGIPLANPPGYAAAAWDPIDNMVVLYPDQGNTLWLLNPKTWKCTTETYGSVKGTDYPQDTNASGHGAFKRFNYFPTLDVFVICNDPQNDCWLLRRRAK